MLQRPHQQSSNFQLQCAADIESQQFNQTLEALPSFDSTSDLAIGHYQLGSWDEGIARAPTNTIVAAASWAPWLINTHPPTAYCSNSLHGQAATTDAASYNFVHFTPTMQHYCNVGVKCTKL